MITAALFTIAKTWKQPKRPSTEEWIKICYIYAIEYCCCCSVAKLCPTLCSLLGCSTPSFPVTVSQSLLRFKSIELVMLSNHYSAIKKNEIMPFAAAWMNLKTVIHTEWKKSDREGGISYGILYMWNQKKTWCKQTYKTEWDSQT